LSRVAFSTIDMNQNTSCESLAAYICSRELRRQLAARSFECPLHYAQQLGIVDGDGPASPRAARASHDAVGRSIIFSDAHVMVL
jgi:hypothetical protein